VVQDTGAPNIVKGFRPEGRPQEITLDNMHVGKIFAAKIGCLRSVAEIKANECGIPGNFPQGGRQLARAASRVENKAVYQLLQVREVERAFEILQVFFLGSAIERIALESSLGMQGPLPAKGLASSLRSNVFFEDYGKALHDRVSQATTKAGEFALDDLEAFALCSGELEWTATLRATEEGQHTVFHSFLLLWGTAIWMDWIFRNLAW
jgi:hypothetical protein